MNSKIYTIRMNKEVFDSIIFDDVRCAYYVVGKANHKIFVMEQMKKVCHLFNFTLYTLVVNYNGTLCFIYLFWNFLILFEIEAKNVFLTRNFLLFVFAGILILCQMNTCWGWRVESYCCYRNRIFIYDFSIQQKKLEWMGHWREFKWIFFYFLTISI